MPINSSAFYGEYHGHRVSHLETLLQTLPPSPKIYLCGDSSLDNKYWLEQAVHTSALNGYEKVLSPPISFPDICHLLNEQLLATRINAVCINAAVEESTLGSRQSGSSLLPQDAFVQRHLRDQDVLIVCAGGNDVVLKPSLSTITSLLALLSCASEGSLEHGTAWGLQHFKSLFKDAYGDYIRALCASHKPKAVLVCMVYYPQYALPGVHSWADTSLGLMGYNTSPEKLQRVMRVVFTHAVSAVVVEGTQVIPFPLYGALDPSSPEDYVQRVEPSAVGGRKMAGGFIKALAPHLPSGGGDGGRGGSGGSLNES